jgi:flagellar biosynthesis GTPase FlhF
MDRLTDILTTFFVTTKAFDKNEKTTKSAKQESVKQESAKQESVNQESSKQESAKQESVNQESSKQESVKQESVKQERVKQERVKQESAKQESAKQESVKQDTFSSSSCRSSDKIYSELSSLYDKQETKSEKQQAVENIGSVKKYILKPSEFYKKNISIVSDDVKSGIEILSDLLYKLSIMKDVDTIYDNRIQIVSDVKNKKLYKQMLLDNPYLYFTEFDVRQNLTKKKVSDLDDLKKRTIYIFDNGVADNYISEIVGKNLQVFVLCNEYDSGFDTYEMLQPNRLLIYKPSKLKMVQKKFYNNYVKKLTDFDKFESYYQKVTDENLDIKYIILKNAEVRYN